MKKKGLIISTIVMVVVLIASLTTATYAWFNTSSFASVDTIQMNVGAASSVAIGVAKVANAGTTQTNYVSGNLTGFNGLLATGGTAGLGTSINTKLNLNVTAGVGSGALAGENGKRYNLQSEQQLASANYIEKSGNTYVWKYGATLTNLYTFNAETGVFTQLTASPAAYSSSTTYYTAEAAASNSYIMDASYSRAENHSLLKAAGDSFDTLKVPTQAIINGTTADGTDVIDLQMAIKPVQPGIYGTYGVIKVTTEGDFVGMISALWADIKVGDKEVVGVDLFDLPETDVHFDSTAKDGADQKVFYFYFMINDKQSTEMTVGNAVTPFSIRLFISGYDEDCNRNATGTSARIDLEFYGVTKVGNDFAYECLNSGENYTSSQNTNVYAITDGTTSFEHAA